MSKLNSTCPINLFQKDFFKKNYSSTLGCRAKLFLSKISGGLEKYRFYVSVGKIWFKDELRKKNLPTSDMQRNLVCFLSKLIRPYTTRENSIIRVHMNTFKAKCFLENSILFSRFGTSIDFFPAFGRLFPPVLWKLQPIKVDEQFEEKNYSKWITNFSSFSDKGQENSGSLEEIFKLGC